MTRLERLYRLWISRSLMIGAVSTTLDLSTGLLMLWLGASTRIAAMTGTVVCATFSYIANRHFAFKDHQEPVARSGLKYLLMQVVLGSAHAQVVVWLRDGMGLPYPLAKVGADLLVVTGPQLYIMRNFIFPAKASAPAPG